MSHQPVTSPPGHMFPGHQLPHTRLLARIGQHAVDGSAWSPVSTVTRSPGVPGSRHTISKTDTFSFLVSALLSAKTEDGPQQKAPESCMVGLWRGAGTAGLEEGPLENTEFTVPLWGRARGSGEQGRFPLPISHFPLRHKETTLLFLEINLF